MGNSSKSLHAANCKVDGCEWSTVAFDMMKLYVKLEDHLKDDHDYTEADWRETREKLTE